MKISKSSNQLFFYSHIDGLWRKCAIVPYSGKLIGFPNNNYLRFDYL